MCHPCQACHNHAQGHSTYSPHPWREDWLVGDLGRDCMGIVGRDGEDEGDWQGGMCVCSF